MSSHEVEIEKLKAASEQVKYRLDYLDRKQKKILCQLFVERVEMRRRKVHNRWSVTGDVFFRFNPEKFERDIEMGRTVKKLVQDVKSRSRPKMDVDGGLVHANLEHLIRMLMNAPQVLEDSRRFSALCYRKDPIHATLFSEAIAY